MRKFLSISVVLLLVGADTPADAVKKDLAQLEGEWSMVSGEREGQAIPEQYLKSGTRTFKDGVVTVKFGDMLLMTAKVTLDASKSPKTVDYDVTDGMFKGKKQLGIYELDGDTAKFCFANPGDERPTSFKTKAGSGQTSTVWKKSKK
ncbi:MAG TPA: TIGR03067 domain-containing protein [Gemmataceae bacterium]|nr:TIGR03067 domain-containing protein [Gemmataceae bacterium]